MKNPAILKYIDNCNDSVKPMLSELYAHLCEKLPNAEQKIAWGVPTFKYKKNFIHFGGFKSHISIFPGGEIVGILKDDLKQFETTKGTIKISNTQKIPVRLLNKIIKILKTMYNIEKL